MDRIWFHKYFESHFEAVWMILKRHIPWLISVFPFVLCAVLDGPGDYELVGFVSHMGSNTACGHYVAHIRKGGRCDSCPVSLLVMPPDQAMFETKPVCFVSLRQCLWCGTSLIAGGSSSMMRRWRNLSTLPRTWATCTFSGVLEEANRRTLWFWSTPCFMYV